MLKKNQYSHFHVVRNLRSLIGKLWKSDIFTLSQEGHVSTLIHENYFYNPLVKHLFSQASFKEQLSEFLLKKVVKKQEPDFIEWPETGFSILFIPMHKEKKCIGFVGVIGFASQESHLKKIEAFKDNHKINTPQFSTQVLNTSDKFYMKELILSLTQEILNFSKIEDFEKPPEKEQEITPQLTMIGESLIMKNLFQFLEKISPSPNNTVIQGENGTGKELIAQIIYKKSQRKNEAFIVQNCSAFNDNLLESELFGHVKGAFTGALQEKKGLFELAHKGTFFLDEVADMSPVMQAKLLRVLQDGTFFPVGSVREKKVDVRVIAATNKNLQKMVAQGTFREDLYYRLNVINIKLPPLRKRKEDIPLLADFFLYKIHPQKNFEPEVYDILQSYHWPGNIRELQNEIQRAVVLSQTRLEISKDCLSDKLTSERLKKIDFTQSENLKIAIRNLEKQMIHVCLREENWNKTQVAKKLGISRAALITKVKTYDLKKKAVN